MSRINSLESKAERRLTRKERNHVPGGLKPRLKDGPLKWNGTTLKDAIQQINLSKLGSPIMSQQEEDHV